MREVQLYGEQDNKGHCDKNRREEACPLPHVQEIMLITPIPDGYACPGDIAGAWAQGHGDNRGFLYLREGEVAGEGIKQAVQDKEGLRGLTTGSIYSRPDEKQFESYWTLQSNYLWRIIWLPIVKRNSLCGNRK